MDSVDVTCWTLCVFGCGVGYSKGGGLSNEKIAAGGLAAAAGFGYTRGPMKAFLPAVLSLFAAAALAQEEVAPAAPAPASEPAPAESSEDEWHPMTEDEENAAKAVLSAALDESFAAAKEKFGADTNRYFVARGVLADREARTVRLDAFATGIRPGAIAEFLLITLNSGHEYESVFQTFALAADIARAFEFLGVPPGLPADFSAYRFWPRGERFEVEAEVDGAPAVPAEGFLMEASTQKPREPAGFLWIGGGWTEGGVSNTVDFSGPGSILPSYNEPVSLFDVPRRAPQNEVYQSCLAGENAPRRAILPTVLTFRPEARPADAPSRVRPVALRLSPEGFSIDGADPVPPAEALKALRAFRTDRAQDAYVSFSWDDAAPLADLRAVAQLLRMVDTEETGIRVDAPPEGFPYYQALLPRDEWRDRAARYSQPCELRLARGEDGAVAATLVAIGEIWKDDALKPDLDVKEFPVANADDFRAKLAEKAPAGMKALLVFVPGALPYGELRPYLDAVRATHPLVQIFVD